MNNCNDPECITGCTNCNGEKYWARKERERIIMLINTWPWNGLSLAEDRANLVALIEGKPMPYKEEE